MGNAALKCIDLTMSEPSPLVFVQRPALPKLGICPPQSTTTTAKVVTVEAIVEAEFSHEDFARLRALGDRVPELHEPEDDDL